LIENLLRKTPNKDTVFVDRIKKVALEYIRQHSFAGHDQTHTIRVHKLSRVIGIKEKADLLILEVAALLHDIGRSYSEGDHAEKSAEIGEKLLKECQLPEDKIPQILYAIRVHRFSRNRIPETLEARILQDADRIDISGAIGIAMTFAYGGSKNTELYDEKDPLARNRALDDEKYVLDHFQTKLLRLPETIHTEMGKLLIQQRSKYLRSFMNQFVQEATLIE
jgi:uncharacterized protein